MDKEVEKDNDEFVIEDTLVDDAEAVMVHRC